LPKLVSEEEKAKYNENPSKWLKENNYSMPITSEQLSQIRGNYQEEVKDNLIAEGKGKLSDNWIMKKWLNDGHGAYTYYSAIYAGEIDKLLKDREGVTEYNRRDFEKEYNQGRYIDKGLPSNYITNSMNESIRRGKLGALDISEYIESLRNGVGLR
ncbi:hypothetical protein, partial [Leptotrichia sp. OH3620_COT-345]|uniref:hypothetical protein n=1 Tax=Leptotrichia sp. OH3620_COT-345 TaxID=2491048 RepID=UPI0013154321